jgi:hypothetical protein
MGSPVAAKLSGVEGGIQRGEGVLDGLGDLEAGQHPLIRGLSDVVPFDHFRAQAGLGDEFLLRSKEMPLPTRCWRESTKN